MNNLAVQEARGDYLLLLNNDTEIIHPEWLDELVRYAQFPEVGAVGGKLLYPDNRIQHAGIFLNDKLVADHHGRFFPTSTTEYQSSHNTVHEVEAVTAACLMVSRKHYNEVGGLDARYLPNGYGDVDFCLKLREKGLTNIYTPYCFLYHHESATRGYEIEYFEKMIMFYRWGSRLMNDRYLNYNLERNHRLRPDQYFQRLDLSNRELIQYFEKF